MSGADNQSNFLKGLSLHSMLTDCPLGAFKVTVEACDGNRDCVATCMVKVFETDSNGRCVAVNDDLCFGCMACLAQCLDAGVKITPREPPEHFTIEELLT
jgi:NAD-dependent dihydropyrimidine dehydrogenase PreA subunit